MVEKSTVLGTFLQKKNTATMVTLYRPVEHEIYKIKSL